MTDVRLLLLGLALCLAACGQPQPSGTVPQKPSAVSPPPAAQAPTPAPEPERAAFYVGRWASSESDCAARSWRFARTSLRAPGGSCAFSDVAAVQMGFRLTGTCHWNGADAPAEVNLAFAQSAQALLVSGAPLGDVGLVACPPR